MNIAARCDGSAKALQMTRVYEIHNNGNPVVYSMFVGSAN